MYSFTDLSLYLGRSLAHAHFLTELIHAGPCLSASVPPYHPPAPLLQATGKCQESLLLACHAQDLYTYSFELT